MANLWQARAFYKDPVFLSKEILNAFHLLETET